jgi:hypothetical protein
MFHFSHLLFSCLYFLLLLCSFALSLPFWINILLCLLFLTIWKFLGGLAWHNFFILLSTFLLLAGLNLFFARSIIIFLAFYIILLFYLQAIKLKQYPHFYDFIRNIFFASILFLFILLLYILFFKLHWSSWIIAFFLAIGSAIFLYWKILIDKIQIDFLTKIVLYLSFIEIIFILFNLSGGFFIYPIISVFWFFILFDLLESISGKNLANQFNIWHILVPILVTIFLIFVFKI